MKKAAIIILVLSICVAILPLVSMVVAGVIANTLGCTLNEASVAVCPSAFGDIGGLLSFMALFGWFVFYSVPLGVVGIVVSIALFIVNAVVKHSKK